MKFSRDLDISGSPDVLVCGAGCAGTVAAVAAARRGASVMLVERTGFAGGYITGVIGASLDGWLDLRSGVPVVGGIVAELAEDASGEGDVMNHTYRPSEYREKTFDRPPVHFDIEGFKRKADRMFRGAGVKVLYHTPVVDVVCEDGRIAGVVIANKAGLSVIRPKQVVDATGDADVAAFAGAPFDISPDIQPMSLHFRIGNVNVLPTMKEQCAAAMKQAQERGALRLYGGPWIGRLAEHEVYFNACRAVGNGADPNDLTAAEVSGREDAYVMYSAFRKSVEGFEDSFFASTGPVVGVRETRRISGDAVLTLADIEGEAAKDDAVALGAWWVDRHPQGSSGFHVHKMVRPYDISYGTLLPKTLSNVWVAGRCHSAESAALASSRVTVTAMAMGEAAGAAAALAARAGTDARGVNIRALQEDLVKSGSVLLDRADRARAVGDAMTDLPKSILR